MYCCCVVPRNSHHIGATTGEWPSLRDSRHQTLAAICFEADLQTDLKVLEVPRKEVQKLDFASPARVESLLPERLLGGFRGAGFVGWQITGQH